MQVIMLMCSYYGIGSLDDRANDDGSKNVSEQTLIMNEAPQVLGISFPVGMIVSVYSTS